MSVDLIWTLSDIEKIERLHEQMKTGYGIPDLSSPSIVLRGLVRDENGGIISAGAVKRIGEVFLWTDHSQSAYKRAAAMVELTQTLESEGKRAGFDEVAAWIAPNIEPEFGRVLFKLGWGRSPWASWNKGL